MTPPTVPDGFRWGVETGELAHLLPPCLFLAFARPARHIAATKVSAMQKATAMAARCSCSPPRTHATAASTSAASPLDHEARVLHADRRHRRVAGRHRPSVLPNFLAHPRALGDGLVSALKFLVSAFESCKLDT